MSTTSTTYEGWRRERQGVVFGLTLAQALVCAGLLAPTLVAMSVQEWAFALEALVAGVLACLFVALPISNRTLAQWTWQLVSFTAGRSAGWTAFRSKAATGLASPSDLAAPDLPGVAASLRFHEGPPMGGFQTRVCLIQAPHARRWFITGRVHHPGIATVDEVTRSAYAAGLSGLLAALSQSESVARLSLLTRSMPDDGAERALWVADHLDPDAPDVLHEAGAHVENVLRAASVRQEHFVTVGVDEDQLRGQARDMGGGVSGRAVVMYRLLAEVEAQVRAAGASSVEWLTGARLSDAVRTGFNPAAAAGIEDARLRAARGQDVLDGTLPGAAGPSMAPSPHVRRYHHDSYVTVSYALLLPSRATTVGRLAGLLSPSMPQERRTLALHFQPLTPHAAQRAVGGSAWSAEISDELRRRGGFRVRLADSSRSRSITAHEADLGAGHQLARTAGAVSVTVPVESGVEDAAARLEASARAAGYQLLRLNLAQDAGFVAAVLPLGIGLPERGAL